MPVIGRHGSAGSWPGPWATLVAGRVHDHQYVALLALSALERIVPRAGDDDGDEQRQQWPAVVAALNVCSEHHGSGQVRAVARRLWLMHKRARGEVLEVERGKSEPYS